MASDPDSNPDEVTNNEDDPLQLLGRAGAGRGRVSAVPANAIKSKRAANAYDVIRRGRTAQTVVIKISNKSNGNPVQTSCSSSERKLIAEVPAFSQKSDDTVRAIVTLPPLLPAVKVTPDSPVTNEISVPPPPSTNEQLEPCANKVEDKEGDQDTENLFKEEEIVADESLLPLSPICLPQPKHVDRQKRNFDEISTSYNAEIKRLKLSESEDESVAKKVTATDRQRPNIPKKGRRKKIAQKVVKKGSKCGNSSVKALLQFLWSDEDSKDLSITAANNQVVKCHVALFARISDFAASIVKEADTDLMSGQVRVFIPDLSQELILEFLKKVYCVQPARDNESNEEHLDFLSLMDLLRINIKAQVSAKNQASFISSPYELSIQSDHHYAFSKVSSNLVTLVRDESTYGTTSQDLSPDDFTQSEVSPPPSPFEPLASGENFQVQENVGQSKDEAPNFNLCPLCGRLFSSALKLEYHINWHNGLTPYECKDCDYKSHSKFKLNCHKNMKHRDKVKICTLCPEVDTKNHKRFHHSPELPFGCSECKYRAGTDAMLRRHAAQHHKDKGYTYDKIQCDKCPAFIQKGSLPAHLRKYHDETLPLGCDECGFRCVTENQLICHKRSMHSKKERMACKNGCGKTFTNLTYLRWHARRHCSKSTEKDMMIQKEKESGVTERKKLQWERGQKKYEELYQLLEPMGEAVANFQEEEKPFKCSECDYRALTEASVNRHYQANHIEKNVEKTVYTTKVQCPKCPTVLTGKVSFEMHQKIHHDPSLPFACDVCEYRAVTENSIKHHKSYYHSDKERMPCTNAGCEKTFTDPQYARRHAKRYCEFSTIREELIENEKKSGVWDRRKQRRLERGKEISDLLLEKVGIRPGGFYTASDPGYPTGRGPGGKGKRRIKE